MYTLSLDPADVDLDATHAFLSRTYWSEGLRRDIHERAVRNSLVCSALHADARGRRSQIGFARAVTDRATFAWIADVYVLPEHRGHGLARRMVRALLGHPDLAHLRRAVLATRDAHGVYAPLGFNPLGESAALWMERRFPDDNWREPTQAPRPSA